MISKGYLQRKTNIGTRLKTPYNGLKVKWFDAWHQELVEALYELPEIESCSHELYQKLIQNPSNVSKRTALVSKDGVPVAIVGLRQSGRFTWEPITQWIIPGAVFPAKPDYIFPTLEALKIDISIAWWRIKEKPSFSPIMRHIESTPTYRMRCSDDIEQYWRDNGYFKTIRRMRNRCKDFTFVINSPDAAEWTIRNWEEKWRTNPEIRNPSLQDRILAAKYLEQRGQFFTLMLLDQDNPIGGATVLVQNKVLVAGVLYSEPSYRQNGVGIRLIDLCFTFAIEKGFEVIDIGGGHDYKENWAIQEGERWWFNLCPEPLYKIKQIARWFRQKIGYRKSG
jgi:hypothetical protein